MDKNEFVKIAIAAVIATCLKELLTFIIKHSPTAAAILRAALIPILRRHLRALPIFFDTLFICFGYWYIFSAVADETTATKAFVASCTTVAILIMQQFQRLPEDVWEYREHLRRTSPNHALQRTAPRVTVAAESNPGTLTSGEPPQ